MIGIIDYGRGNLGSVEKAFSNLGYETLISSKIEELRTCQGYVLPGVGAFAHGMEALEALGLDVFLREVVKEQKPLLGICLGMQLFFSEGEENGLTKGLNLLNGRVVKLETEYKIPHMGWNNLENIKESPLTEGLNSEDSFYFVHSYKVVPSSKENILAQVNYGEGIPAIIGEGNLYGIQFHPEKSSLKGLSILNNFGKLVSEWS